MRFWLCSCSGCWKTMASHIQSFVVGWSFLHTCYSHQWFLAAFCNSWCYVVPYEIVFLFVIFNPSNEILLFGFAQTHDFGTVSCGVQLLECALSREGCRTQGNMLSPCCVGSVFLFDPHARWECHFCMFQHLRGENARKLAFLKLSNGFVTCCLISGFRWCPKMMYVWPCCKKGVPTMRGDHIFQLALP